MEICGLKADTLQVCGRGVVRARACVTLRCCRIKVEFEQLVLKVSLVLRDDGAQWEPTLQTGSHYRVGLSFPYGHLVETAAIEGGLQLAVSSW